MDTTRTAGRSGATDDWNTPLPVILEKLWVIDSTESSGKSNSRAARLQAARWLIELDCTVCLNDTWAKFEGWLHEHADHHAMYLKAERTRRILDDLGRYCPPEGSTNAERLL